MRIREEMDNSNNTLYNRKGNAVVADSIRCITCRNIPKQCLETPCCSSVVCGDCSKLLRFCPNCSEVFTTELKVNLPLQRIIDTMAAFCEVCEQSNSHADSCPRKQVSCPYLCGQSIPVVDVESHVKECDFVEVACPNSCGSSIRKKDLEKHTATDCWIPCKYARYGCSFNGTIPMLQEHNKNYCHSHLEMLMNTVDRQNTEIQQLQQQRIEIPCHAVINRFRTAYGPTLRMAANQITPRELKTFAFFMILFMSLPKFFAAIALGIIPLMLISAFQQNDQPKILKTGSALLAGVLYAILPWFLCILLVAFSLCSTTVPGRRWFAMISHFVNRL